MAPEEPVASSSGSEAADLAKAFQEVAKGERTATMLESQLSKMEERIEALLLQAEKEQEGARETKKEQDSADKHNHADGGNDEADTTGQP